MATDPPKTVLEAPAVPLWIMVGALGILIGLIVAIFWALFGVILCYAGVMTVIVAGAQLWMRSIDTQPDLDAAGRNQSQNGVLVASVFSWDGSHRAGHRLRGNAFCFHRRNCDRLILGARFSPRRRVSRLSV